MRNLISLLTATLVLLTATTISATPVTNDPVVVTQAGFIGGQEELGQYLEKNLVYPDCARQDGIEGEVTISFHVLSNGSIHGAKVVEGLTEKCDKVALKVISEMPNWIPATRNGKAMSSKYQLKIHFSLEN